MKRVLQSSPDAEESATIRAIVERHALPEFVESVEVQLGYFAGEPAAWINFRLSGSDDIGLEQLERRADVLLPLQDTLIDELSDAKVERYPFFRISYSSMPQHAT